MQWLYLIALMLSIAGLATLDWRHKLAFWYDHKRTIITLVIGVGIFLLWDLAAISQGIFIHGSSNFALPYTIVPEFPVEELFFLILLCYSTLIIYRTGVTKWPRT